MNGRKSVLLIGNYPPPYGGVPIHIADLSPYLVHRGWAVTVLSLKFGKEQRKHEKGCEIYSLVPMSKFGRLWLLAKHVSKVTRHFPFFLDDWREFIRCLKLYEMAADIVKINSPCVVSAYHIFPSGLVGAWLVSDFGVKLVTTIFGEIYAKTQWHHRHIREVELVFTHSSRMLSCSKHCAQSARLLSESEIVSKASVEAIYYGVDTARFSPENDGYIVRRNHGIGDSDPVILFAGRMVEEMGLGVVLRAVPDVLLCVPDAKFFIVGAAGELTSPARELSKRYPMSVFVHQNVSAEKMPLYYAGATLTVVPSINERACLGLAILESLATGVPAIVADVGGGPEIISEGRGGVLIPPADSGALAKSIVNLVTDPVRRRQLGTSARMIATQYFSRETANHALEGVFSSVVS